MKNESFPFHSELQDSRRCDYYYYSSIDVLRVGHEFKFSNKMHAIYVSSL